jgi:hypothetical protein
MTTATWSTTNTCTTDAEFRALIVELQGKFSAVGLVQTSDTGQINTSTVAKPTVNNTAAGYDIWRFNDTTQSTAPLYIKLEYGVTGTVTLFGMWITIGSGTDGAGNLTGVTTTRRQTSPSSGSPSVSTWTSYLCYKDGFLGLVWKAGGMGSSIGQNVFAISRTCDGSGAWSATGAVLYTRNTVLANTALPVVQAVRFASTATSYTQSTGGFCLVPHASIVTSSGNNPIYLHWMPSPDMVPVLGMCTHVTSQISLGTFTATLVGTTARTYLTMGATALGFGYGAENGTTQYCNAMLWE